MFEERIAESKRTARRWRRRATKDAERAESWYVSAKKYREYAAWLTQRPDLWTGDNVPEKWERIAAIFVRMADSYLRSSFSNTKYSRFYFQLSRRYERMSA